jgi:SAM-dependent methyltransferase
MDERALIASWHAEERAPFSGWDFGHIAGRLVEEEPPWSYDELVRSVMRSARSVLDLGTGGGEVLSRLRDAFPARVVATETYAPNVAVARARLGPLGVTVVPYEATETSAPLPFADGSFDAILSRHEAYEAPEVARVLAPGGRFLTQQVDGRSLEDLLPLFGVAPQFPDVTVERLSSDLRDAGLAVSDARAWWGRMVVRDVGALVYYLRAVPWDVPEFSVDRFTAPLLQLHRRLTREGELGFRIGRIVVQAWKALAGGV